MSIISSISKFGYDATCAAAEVGVNCTDTICYRSAQAGGFALSAGAFGYEIVKGTVGTILHPIETAKTLSGYSNICAIPEAFSLSPKRELPNGQFITDERGLCRRIADASTEFTSGIAKGATATGCVASYISNETVRTCVNTAIGTASTVAAKGAILAGELTLAATKAAASAAYDVAQQDSGTTLHNVGYYATTSVASFAALGLTYLAAKTLVVANKTRNEEKQTWGSKCKMAGCYVASAACAVGAVACGVFAYTNK